MTKTAIYCRVSSDSQEREGTSLQTQLENCLAYCQNRGYEVAYRFSEAFSGLSLERPKLDTLRDLVRAGDIEMLVCYSLDRFTRVPGHGVILTQELEKHNVVLETVTEDVDNTELGKLISYIRGFASKLEAEKIRERTMRGRKAKAKLGHITGGGFARTYGYDYVRASDGQTGRRIINENEAAIVQQMFDWVVNEGISSTAITNKLNSMGVRSKKGGYWSKKTVLSVLNNVSYTGKTIAFTTAKGQKQFSRPPEDWIEIPGVTPAIVSQEQFEAAQKQLKINRQKTVNTPKHSYLLRGHLRCRQCGLTYTGGIHTKIVNEKRYSKLRYRCMGKVRAHSPAHRCTNRNWMADKLEPLVWNEIERYLSNPDFLANWIEQRQNEADKTNGYEAELELITRQLKEVEREQRQLLKWALKDFPADQIELENKRINKAKITLEEQKAVLEKKIKANQENAIDVLTLEQTIQELQDKLPELDFEGKRLALDWLGITVWLDGDTVGITGSIYSELGVTQVPQTGQSSGPRRAFSGRVPG